MKKFNFFMAIFLMATLISSCQKKPAQIVDDIYKSANQGEYSKILPYMISDTINPFTEQEQLQFNSLMTGVMPATPIYVSYEVVCPEVSDADSVIRFKVNTSFADGMSFAEEGTLGKNAKGGWIILFEQPENDTVPLYSVKDNTKKSPELIRNLQYAYDLVMASRGIPEYQIKAALHYKDSVFQTPDLNKYFSLISSAAERGNPMALRLISNAYYNGYGVEKNEEKTFEYCKKAAEGGDKIAIGNLGWCYQTGYGTPKNYEEAVNWYQKGSELNDGMSLGNLAVMYSNGEGVEKDPVKAFELTKKAAELGMVVSMTNLANDYRYGTGTEKNMPEALKWYTKAAEKSDRRAMRKLGDIYFGREKDIPKDYSKAFYWYKKGADLPLDNSYNDEIFDLCYLEYMVGKCYQEGKGVDVNIQKAREYYGSSADKGNREAQWAYYALY